MAVEVPRWRLARGKCICLDRPAIMAILNVTPDSFFDGGRFPNTDAVINAAGAAVDAGASILDIGGESTRPGATRVDPQEQMRRVIPAVRGIRAAGGALATIPISVDTTLSEVAGAAIDAGADAINDVSAGTEDTGMFALAARTGAGLVLMHRLAAPGSDSYSDGYATPPVYGDVVAEVREFLRERMEAAVSAGVGRESIVLDPGLGFGKTVEQNLELIRRTGELLPLGRPILSGLSRKSFTARSAGVRGEPPSERLGATLGLSRAHRDAGASLFRVHDVAEHAALLGVAARL